MILKNGRYAIHEVYYDEEGEPWTYSEEPVFPAGKAPDRLRDDLRLYQLALEHTVLQYVHLVPYYGPTEPDIDCPPACLPASVQVQLMMRACRRRF